MKSDFSSIEYLRDNYVVDIYVKHNMVYFIEKQEDYWAARLDKEKMIVLVEELNNIIKELK